MGHIYIALTIFLTVYGQIVIKWQVGLAGQLPIDMVGKAIFLLHVLLNPWVISGFISAFIASLAWMVAMSKFPLSYAYPFMSLSFVFVLLSSTLFFGESINLYKIAGVILIMLGVVVSSL